MSLALTELPDKCPLQNHLSNSYFSIRDSVMQSVTWAPVPWSASKWLMRLTADWNGHKLIRLSQRNPGMHIHIHIIQIPVSDISIISTAFVFYFCETNYHKLRGVKYEFIFSQFLCIWDLSTVNLCPLLKICIATINVSLCCSFWTWGYLAYSCRCW